MSVFGRQVRKASIAKIQIGKELGGVVEETLSSVKLITSFAQEQKEIEKFKKIANIAKNIAQSTELWIAGFTGVFRFSIFGFYVYSFWIGCVFIKNERINPANGKPYTTGDLLAVIMAIMTGMAMIFTLTPNI